MMIGRSRYGQNNPADFYAWSPTVEPGSGASFHKPQQFGTMQLVEALDPTELIFSDGIEVGSFVGAAVGQGIDMQGNFVFAVNILGPATNDDGTPLVVGDASFTTDDSTDGFTISADHEIANWETSPSFGESADDLALAVLLRSIRWSSFPSPVSFTFSNLEVGVHYKLQMLFYEECCSRGFDIWADGAEILGEFSPQAISVGAT